jgi:MAD (mothers against decapentaplegic) interacting protein
VTCCVNKLCWVFSTCGLCAIGQEELLYIIEFEDNANDERFPKQIFLTIIDIYERACKGERINSMTCGLYRFNYSRNESELFGNAHNAGFLYYLPSMKFVCLQMLDCILPTTSTYLVGILLQKWEVPWAKLFPLRLFLAFGAQTNCYPCTHVSKRTRESLYGNEIGHTIMNILCDMKNFQYTIPQIKGMLSRYFIIYLDA